MFEYPSGAYALLKPSPGPSSLTLPAGGVAFPKEKPASQRVKFYRERDRVGDHLANIA